MRYHRPPRLSHDEAERTLEAAHQDTQSVRAASDALIGLALYDDDRVFVERWCLHLADTAQDAQLLGLVGLCLGHLARRFGQLSGEAGTLAAHLAQRADVDSRAQDGWEDVQQFARSEDEAEGSAR